MIDPKVFKQVRKALGLSQDQLATALGLSRVTVNKMERGRLRRGIPDQIGAQLMALNPTGLHFQRMTPKAIGELKDAYGGLPVPDDSHLWDNEEDDQ